MIQGFESKRFHKDSIEISMDMVYNRETGHLDFLVYGGKSIPTEDDWGFYDYFFVIQYEIVLGAYERKDRILRINIIKDNDPNNLKSWWRSYMRSYKDPKYAKNEIEDKHDVIPPSTTT